MSLFHEKQRAQHGHPLHRDHTEDLEIGIASAVREIDEMRAALGRVHALADRWIASGNWSHGYAGHEVIAAIEGDQP